jgi:hypothetical protein
MLGLACGIVAGAVTWAIEPVRSWWWVAAAVVAAAVWSSGRIDLSGITD